MKDKHFYDMYDLARCLGVESCDLLQMIRDGLLPLPCFTRNKIKLWSKEDVAGIAYLLKLIADKRIVTVVMP